MLLVPRPGHCLKDPAAAGVFRGGLAGQLEALELEPGARVRIWVMDEARFGLHTCVRRLRARRGNRPVVRQQIKYEWDYLYGSLDITGGEAHFCQIPSVSLEWDRVYLEDLAATEPGAVHVVIRDQAGFHLRDGDERLPERVRLVDLPPYSPELNPCEQFWDLVRDETGNKVFDTIDALREAMMPVLKQYWSDSRAVLRLIGREWLGLQSKIFAERAKVTLI